MSAETWRTITLVKDGLLLNDSIVCLQQRAIDAERLYDDANESPTTILSMICVGHSSVLAMKPNVDVRGCASHLVRMAHILESGRVHKKYDDALVKVCCAFDFKVCEELPTESAAWRTPY